MGQASRARREVWEILGSSLAGDGEVFARDELYAEEGYSEFIEMGPGTTLLGMGSLSCRMEWRWVGIRQ